MTRIAIKLNEGAVMNKSVIDYTKQLFAFARYFTQTVYVKEDVSFRLVRLPDDRDPHLYFQVVGKNVFAKMLPEEIMRDDLLLRFNKADIALITHLGTKNEIRAKEFDPGIRLFKIIKQFFKNGAAFFAIEKENGVVEEFKATDIYSDSCMAAKIDGPDGMQIGYSVAEEHYQKILRLKEKS